MSELRVCAPWKLPVRHKGENQRSTVDALEEEYGKTRLSSRLIHCPNPASCLDLLSENFCQKFHGMKDFALKSRVELLLT